MPPRVTLITPTYNRASLVTRAIDSALAQTYPDLELIVVDDGSTDETPLVLERYEGNPRVRIIRLERNRGVTGAKNAGISSVRPDTAFFAILDSDDRLMPTAIETLVGAFEGHEDDYSQVLGWCVNGQTGHRTGQFPRLDGPITYDDALSGRFEGDFFHLARYPLIAERRFDERAAGAESAVWWPLLKLRDAWLVDAVVYEVDTSGSERVSLIDYSRPAARGKMWACQAVLSAVGDDLRSRYPQRYGAWSVELAKWAALAGESRRARAAGRQGVRFARSRHALVIAAFAHLPEPIVRIAAGWRRRLRGPIPGRPESQ